MCCYSRQLCWSILNILEGTENKRFCMIITTVSTFMSQGNKDGEYRFDIQGNHSGVYDLCSMNRNDEMLQDSFNRKYPYSIGKQ